MRQAHRDVMSSLIPMTAPVAPGCFLNRTCKAVNVVCERASTRHVEHGLEPEPYTLNPIPSARVMTLTPLNAEQRLQGYHSFMNWATGVCDRWAACAHFMQKQLLAFLFGRLSGECSPCWLR